MTLTLTSDELENDIVVNDSSTVTNTTINILVCGCIEFDCGRTYGRTDGRTYVAYGRTDGFIRSSHRR